MESIKIDNLRLRGCGFTLEPTCKEAGVEFELLHSLLILAHNKAKKNAASLNRIEQINQTIPTEYSKDELTEHFNSFYGTLDECLLKEFLVESNSNYEFSEKTMKIFEKVSEIQSKLDAENFYYCPCAHFF